MTEPEMSHYKTSGPYTCNKGHDHRPWNTTGVLAIEKCETRCGFCRKETKTAANLRKHVAIHIKNERLNLVIAEGSSGRGRLEMANAAHERRLSRSSDVPKSENPSPSRPPSYPRVQSSTQIKNEPFSPSAALLSMAYQAQPNTRVAYSPQTNYVQSSTTSSFAPSYVSGPLQHDPFKGLRAHKLNTKIAWMPIPSSEGLRILELCKSLSTTSSSQAGAGDSELHVPCYNRETLFDEEWQAHMKNIHGVYLLWPDTWMRRIEVLDLDPFGGDIEACNEVIMEG